MVPTQARVWTPENRTFRLDLVLVDAAGTDILAVSGPTGTFNSNTLPGWGSFSATIDEVPANAVYAWARVICTTTMDTTSAAWYVTKFSFHKWNYFTWVLGGTSGEAPLQPAHNYDLCERVPGEIYIVGSYTATKRAGMARSLDNGITWEPVVFALDTPATGSGYARFYNVAALNGVVYTVLGGGSGSGSNEKYNEDVGDPCYKFDGSALTRGPVLDGFIHPQIILGRIVYRSKDGRLLAYDGINTITQLRSRGCVAHCVDNGYLYVLQNNIIYRTNDFQVWEFFANAPETAASLTVLSSSQPPVAFVGTNDSRIWSVVQSELQRGEIGPQGIQGPVGPQGPQGVAGSQQRVYFAAINAFTNLTAAFIEGAAFRTRGRANLAGYVDARIELVVSTWVAGTAVRVEYSVNGTDWFALLPDVNIANNQIGGAVVGPWGAFPSGLGEVVLRMLLGGGDGVNDPVLNWWGAEYSMNEIVVVKTQRISGIIKDQKIVIPVKTQKIVVSPNRSVAIVKAGPAGPTGATGLQGPAGKGSGERYYGEGPPGVIIGAAPGDEYVDSLTGNIYRLE